MLLSEVSLKTNSFFTSSFFTPTIQNKDNVYFKLDFYKLILFYIILSELSGIFNIKNVK